MSNKLILVNTFPPHDGMLEFVVHPTDGQIELFKFELGEKYPEYELNKIEIKVIATKKPKP